MVNKCTMEIYPRLTSHTTEERQLSCFGTVKLKILKEEKITAISMQRPNNWRTRKNNNTNTQNCD